METALFDTIASVLFSVTAICFTIQIIYYLTLYMRIYLHTRRIRQGEVHFTQELPPLSVIIYAHEEVENLRRSLPAILEQDYPEFEVIVINDGETDTSEEYLTQLENRYPYLYHSFIPASSRYISRKKLAVTLGIKASKYDWLVLSEPNCKPQSDQWLRLMARNFTAHTQIVLGYSGYEYGKGWLRKKVDFDNLFGSMRYLGLALAHLPYMGVGRNMAYRKELFYQQKGFSAHLNLQKGDDDLFVNQVANADNTRVETDAQATVRMPAPTRVKDWKEEKINYSQTARLYHGPQPLITGLETTTRMLFHVSWIGATACSVYCMNWLSGGIALSFFFIRLAVQASIINLTAKALGEKRRYYVTLPVFDLLLPLQSLQWRLSCLLRNKQDFLRK